MYKRLLLIPLLGAVYLASWLLDLIGLAGTPQDLDSLGKFMTAWGVQNVAALLILLLAAWLFYGEIKTRRNANPTHFLHQLYRRKKIRRLFSRVQWTEHEHVVAIIRPGPKVEALTISGKNYRGSGMIITSAAFISNSPNMRVDCLIFNAPIPASGYEVLGWNHFKVTGDLKGITLKQFRDNWEEFRLVLHTNKGEFTEYFSKPEIDAILYREIVGQWTV